MTNKQTERLQEALAIIEQVECELMEDLPKKRDGAAVKMAMELGGVSATRKALETVTG